MKHRFCSWCAHPFDDVTARVNDDDSWRCGNCSRVTLTVLGEVTCQRCPACGEGFEASAHFCPMCGADSQASPPSTLLAQGLLPSPRQPMWPTKSWWHEDGRGIVAPLCTRCGSKVRRDGSGEHRHIGTACPPWNAGWDGHCESCGSEVSLTIEQRTHFHAGRTVRVRPREHFHQTFIDEGMVFSGVEIEVTDAPHSGEPPATGKVFLSMGELMTLVKALQDPANPWLAQQDWTCDWT